MDKSEAKIAKLERERQDNAAEMERLVERVKPLKSRYNELSNRNDLIDSRIRRERQRAAIMPFVGVLGGVKVKAGVPLTKTFMRAPGCLLKATLVEVGRNRAFITFGPYPMRWGFGLSDLETVGEPSEQHLGPVPL